MKKDKKEDKKEDKNLDSNTSGDCRLERCYDERKTAKALGVSVALLRKRRRLGLEPRFVRIGKAVRYPESAIRSFMALASDEWCANNAQQ